MLRNTLYYTKQNVIVVMLLYLLSIGIDFVFMQGIFHGAIFYGFSLLFTITFLFGRVSQSLWIWATGNAKKAASLFVSSIIIPSIAFFLITSYYSDIRILARQPIAEAESLEYKSNMEMLHLNHQSNIIKDENKLQNTKICNIFVIHPDYTSMCIPNFAYQYK